MRLFTLGIEFSATLAQSVSTGSESLVAWFDVVTLGALSIIVVNFCSWQRGVER